MKLIHVLKTKRTVDEMKLSEKSANVQQGDNQLFGIDFHDFIQKEQHATVYELASEFGLTYKDVRKLKKKLEKF